MAVKSFIGLAPGILLSSKPVPQFYRTGFEGHSQSAKLG
jgi:hypothetical protein